MTKQAQGEQEVRSPIEVYRSLREKIPKLARKESLKPLGLSISFAFSELFGLGLMIWIFTWIFLWITLSSFDLARFPSDVASNSGVFAMCAFWCAPFLSLLFKKSQPRRLQKWELYSLSHRFIACMALTFILGNVVKENIFPLLYPQNQQNLNNNSLKNINSPNKNSKKSNTEDNARDNTRNSLAGKPILKTPPFSSLTTTQVYLFGWPLCFISLFVFMAILSEISKRRDHNNRSRKKISSLQTPKTSFASANVASSQSPKSDSFSLWLGESTGTLGKQWHSANLAAHQQIGLTLPEACQNIAIFGAIGSGKTTRAMHPVLMQLLDQNCGGLIFDIKGDFKKAVIAFADITKRDITLIGVNQQPLNLLQGLSPEIAASFLKSALLLAGNGKADSFWVDTSVEVCRNALGVLSFVPKHYHLNSLYLYLFDKTFQQEIKNQLSEEGEEGKRKAKDPDKARLLKIYQHYLDSIFAGFEDKIKSGVLASISQILSPFQHPDLVDAFCQPPIVELPIEKSIIDSEAIDQISQAQPQNPFSENAMEDVLNGTIYVVDMPLARWGLAGKVIYTFIKLRFFNLMQQRALHPEWNQSLPVFFMCDEYQEIVSCNKDGLSDLNFWDKSRSSQTIGIISAQSISSFYAAIGDRDLVHALLQNFRQKLVFRVEDDWTIQYCNRILGQVETQKIIDSISSGTSAGNESKSSGQSLNYQQKDVIDGQLFRNMNLNQVLALLSLNGAAADDILEVKPLFVPASQAVS